MYRNSHFCILFASIRKLEALECRSVDPRTGERLGLPDAGSSKLLQGSRGSPMVSTGLRVLSPCVLRMTYVYLHINIHIYSIIYLYTYIEIRVIHMCIFYMYICYMFVVCQEHIILMFGTSGFRAEELRFEASALLQTVAVARGACQICSGTFRPGGRHLFVYQLLQARSEGLRCRAWRQPQRQVTLPVSVGSRRR